MPDELSREEIDALLRRELVGRIGCHAGGATYVVPVIYAYDGRGFVVASVEGRKLRMMRESRRVSFEVDRYERETGSWESAIADGTFEELAGADAEAGLDLLAARFGRRRTGGESRHGDGARAVVFRIRIDGISGRAMRRG